ncbi:MAG: DUF421 domain-containing protein [Clostridia bacterium]|nr:DUF421 domain-containing protein [Clostridia bacterium]
MIIVFIRSVIIFIVLLIVMRLMGKRQIGEMQPFEFVITLLIAELACIPMADISIPLIYGIVAILAVFILHQLFSFVEQIDRKAKKVISGKPSIVLNKDGVDFVELKRNNLDVEDLIESMRSAGYFCLDDLDYAIYESNGKLSAKEKEDFCDKKPSLPIIIIADGKIIDDNTKRIGFNENKINMILKAKKISELKKVGVMTVDGDGKVYLQEENKRYMTFNVDLGGIKW